MMLKVLLISALIALAVADDRTEACKCEFCDMNMISATTCATDCFPTFCEDKMCSAKEFCNSLDFSDVDCSTTTPPTPTTWKILQKSDTEGGKPWSFGYKVGPSITANDALLTLDYPTANLNPPNSGYLYRREATPPSQGGSWLGVGFSDYVGEESVFTHPGESGQRSVLRFTAPAAGCYSFDYKSWGSGDTNQDATSDIAITKGATVLFSSDMTGKELNAIPDDKSAQVRMGTVSVDLAQGDAVDFSVGYGPNQDYSYDDTRWQLSATDACSPDYPQRPIVDSVGQGWTFGQFKNTAPQVFEELIAHHMFAEFPNAEGLQGTDNNYPKIMREPTADYLLLHPSAQNYRAAVRYTAPESQCYVFKYQFWPSHFGGTASGDAAVSINSKTVYSAPMVGTKPANPPTDPHELCVSLQKDMTIDFTVGNNGNGYEYDLVALDVEVDTNCQQVCKFMFYYPAPTN